MLREVFDTHSLREKTNGDLRGFRPDRQRDRRQVFSDMLDALGSQDPGDRKHNLLHDHGLALQDSLAHFEKLGLQMPMSDFSRQALDLVQASIKEHPASFSQASMGSGSQPSVQPANGRRRDYVKLLQDKGLIEKRHGHKGRKPDMNVREVELTWRERDRLYNWGAWWMQLGTFSASFVIDKCIFCN